MRHLIALLFVLAPSVAFAQVPFFGKENPVRISGMTGCTATAINSASSCELADVSTSYNKKFPRGYNLLTLYIYYDWAAGTGYSFKIDACKEGLETTDCTDATDWYPVHGETYSAGTMTLASATFTKGSVSADDYAVWSVAINYPRIRLSAITASGSPTASDKITVVAEFTNSGAF